MINIIRYSPLRVSRIIKKEHELMVLRTKALTKLI